MSGIPDYDGEDYAQQQFSHKAHDFSPLEIFQNFTETKMRFGPGTRQSYCSTNYILLGMLLAEQLNVSDWTQLHQQMVLPNQSVAFNE